MGYPISYHDKSVKTKTDASVNEVTQNEDSDEYFTYQDPNNDLKSQTTLEIYGNYIDNDTTYVGVYM